MSGPHFPGFIPGLIGLPHPAKHPFFYGESVVPLLGSAHRRRKLRAAWMGYAMPPSPPLGPQHSTSAVGENKQGEIRYEREEEINGEAPIASRARGAGGPGVARPWHRRRRPSRKRPASQKMT